MSHQISAASARGYSRLKVKDTLDKGKIKGVDGTKDTSNLGQHSASGRGVCEGGGE